METFENTEMPLPDGDPIPAPEGTLPTEEDLKSIEADQTNEVGGDETGRTMDPTIGPMA